LGEFILGVLIRLGLIVGVFLISHLIYIVVRKKDNNILLFIIMGFVSLLLSYIWNGEYGSFLQTWGIVSLLVALIGWIKGRIRNI
jgi:hypothetical protein